MLTSNDKTKQKSLSTQNDREIERISMPMIYRYLLSIINLDRGFLFTVKRFSLKPGLAAKAYLNSLDRRKYMKPISFIMLISIVSVYITFLYLDNFAMEEGGDIYRDMKDMEAEVKKSVMVLFAFMREYQHLLELLLIPFLALAARWIFPRCSFNYAEHLVVNCYLVGIQIIIHTIAIALGIFINFVFFSAIALVLAFIYALFAYRQIYASEMRFWPGLVRAAGVFIVGKILNDLLKLIPVGGYLWWKGALGALF